MYAVTNSMLFLTGWRGGTCWHFALSEVSLILVCVCVCACMLSVDQNSNLTCFLAFIYSLALWCIVLIVFYKVRLMFTTNRQNSLFPSLFSCLTMSVVRLHHLVNVSWWHMKLTSHHFDDDGFDSEHSRWNQSMWVPCGKNNVSVNIHLQVLDEMMNMKFFGSQEKKYLK